MQETESFANSIVLVLFFAIVFLGLTVRKVSVYPPEQEHHARHDFADERKPVNIRYRARMDELAQDQRASVSIIETLCERLPLGNTGQIVSFEDFQYVAFNNVQNLVYVDQISLEADSMLGPKETKENVMRRKSYNVPGGMDSISFEASHLFPADLLGRVEFNGTVNAARFIYYSTMKNARLSMWVFFNRDTNIVLGFAWDHYPYQDHKSRIEMEEF